MLRRSLWLFGLCLTAQAFAADTPSQKAPRDLYLGEAFYYAQQGEYFDAISRLDTELGQFYRLDERNLDPFHLQSNFAEFSVGDFELSYRMHQRAGRAIKAVLEGNVSQDIKNEAAFRLARIYYQKSEPENALHAIERITGKVPDRISDDEQFLRAQINMVNGRFAEAIAILQGMKNSKGYEGFAGYNLGIALIQNDQEKAGLAQLEKTGQISSKDEGTLSIKDKANLVLGYRLLESNQPGEASQYLDRVRLVGPFSEKALLGSGWSSVSAGRFDRALVPWTLLVKRNPTGKAVQESLLGVPYSYAKLDMHGKAALLYGSALESFGQELNKLDASLESIHKGNFLKALVREELKQDSNWVIRLRELPETPETFYLKDLMASNDFQSSLQNYFDLDDLRKRLIAWDEYVDSWEEMIDLRRRYYEPLLPEIDKKFRALDSQFRLRMEQRQSLDDRLQHMLIAPRPDFLMTTDERILREQLARLEAQFKDDTSEGAADARRRIKRLQGRIHFEIHTTYDQRLTDAYKHLHELDADVARLKEIYAAFVRTRQAATQSYQGYDDQIRHARNRSRDAKEKVATLMARQGHMLELMAINEFEQRRERLEDYQVQARFAMAESYDRAVKAQQQGMGSVAK
ncbi:MAG TPA: tetratricopeptide repeat protein [Thiobacillus sp.]|nr:tetratricopeptide repeat protein [Thiobacillus sp.]